MIDKNIAKELESPFYTLYEIKKGDSLYKISKEFNVNTKLLSELNGLNLDDYIYPGESLVVPNINTKFYITEEGENLNKVLNILGVPNPLENQNIYLLPNQLIVYKN